MPAILTKEVHSSNVNTVGYDASKSELHVTWKNGKTSVYKGVPPDVANAAANEWSVGKFIKNEIAPNYEHRYSDVPSP